MLLEVDNLQTYFFTAGGVTKAVDGVSFALDNGQSMALVGESGCGKSTIALSIIGLVLYPGKIVGGRVLFDGQDLTKVPPREMRRVRARKMGLVFQDPQTTLNPAFTIGEQVAESILAAGGTARKAAWDRAVAAMEEVGIASAAERAKQYPHEFSGGMRQRTMIAAAIARSPSLFIADEPTTALDVTIQAQILDLIRRERERLDTALLLITHDLGIVGELCETAAVMYAGQLVERAPTASLLSDPLHPYSRALIGCVPRLGSRAQRLPTVGGSVPDLANLPQGCRFADRCPEAMDICRQDMPEIIRLENGREVRCYLHA